jgi:FdrA protein
MRYVGRLVRALDPAAAAAALKPVDLSTLNKPLAAINVGLESFAENLGAQGAPVIHVDWRPPAGGNDRIMALLEKMKAR